MKKIISLVVILFSAFVARGQYFPDTAWTRCYGGSDWDEGFDIQQTFEGGYIVVGSSKSTDGDLAGAIPDVKSWIIKLDSVGNIEWQKWIHWNQGMPKNIEQTPDSGYIHGGNKFTKLKPNGSIDWQVNYSCGQVTQTQDGGFAIQGGSIRKLSPVATEDWSYTMIMMSSHLIERTADSGVLAAGIVPEGGIPDALWYRISDKYGNHGPTRYYSGVCSEFAGMSTLDHKYIFAGNYCDFDTGYGVMVKVDDSNILWTSNYGSRIPFDLIQNIDSTYILCGKDWPNDAFILKTTVKGNELSSHIFGGSGVDEFTKVVQTKDGGYITIGTTWSNDGHVWGNHGTKDLWIVKFKPDTSVHVPVKVKENTAALKEVKVYPNPSSGVINVAFASGEKAVFGLVNIVGQSVPIGISGSGKSYQISITNQPTGQYILQISTGTERKSYRITYMP